MNITHGSRVALVGDHPHAGKRGEFVGLRQTIFGLKPVVRLDGGGECFVMGAGELAYEEQVMGELITGYVGEVHFQPGRADGLLGLSINERDGETFRDLGTHQLFTNDSESDVTFDGVKVERPELLTKLAESPTWKVAVTIWPRVDRYGAATRAEFKTVSM